MSKKWRMVVIVGGVVGLCLVGVVIVLALMGPAAGGRFDEIVAYAPQGAAKEAHVAVSYSEGVDYDDVRNRMEPAVQPQERLIIRNANLSIVVDNTEASLAAIEELVSSVEGWVVSSNVWEYDGVKRGDVGVRVPAEQLDSFLDAVHALANQVTNQSISGQDVTEEYVDIQAQLANLQATAGRVRSFLDEAENVEEALAVNVELGRLEGEIERITGRIKYLESSARYSSVSIEITPDALAQPVSIGRWQPEGTARNAIQALISTLQWLADALIVLALYVLPLALVIGGPIYLFIRYLRKRRAAAD